MCQPCLNTAGVLDVEHQTELLLKLQRKTTTTVCSTRGHAAVHDGSAGMSLKTQRENQFSLMIKSGLGSGSSGEVTVWSTELKLKLFE